MAKGGQGKCGRGGAGVRGGRWRGETDRHIHTVGKITIQVKLISFYKKLTIRTGALASTIYWLSAAEMSQRLAEYQQSYR